MLNDDEQREVRSLNPGLYGPGGAAICAEELAGLHQLEQQRTAVDAPVPTAAEIEDYTTLIASNSSLGAEAVPPRARGALQRRQVVRVRAGC